MVKKRPAVPRKQTGKVQDLLAKAFGLDLRSLAAFRIGLAAFILFDLINRSFDLTAHYTDAGVAPRPFVVRYFSSFSIYHSWNPALFSVHQATGTATGIAVIFLVHAAAAIALLLGYRTRLMTFIVWFLLCSLHTRNPLVLSVGDDVLRVLLFFSIFLPLGARYSIDDALNSAKEPPDPELYTSWSTAVYYLQFACIYFFSALLKSAPEWRSEGTALYYAFSFDQFALPLGKALLHFPALLKVLTPVVWWLELLGAFVLMIPHPSAKLAGVLLFAGLQAGIAATLALGHNPWVNCVVLLPFLPAWIWDRERSRKRETRPRVDIIYDGDCGVCRKLVLILVEFLRPRLNDSPQAARGKDLVLLRRENSWIVRNEAGIDFFRFDAFIQLVSSSSIFSWAAPLLRLRPIHFIGTIKYRWVAGHRRLLAALLSPLRIRPVRLRTYWWREALAVFFFAGALIFNIAWLKPLPWLTAYFDPPTLITRLEQHWGMFAPAPNRDDGWYVIEGQLRNASKVEAFRRERQVSYEKPKSAGDFYPDERWRRFMINIGIDDYKAFRLSFSHYLCTEWNEKNSGSEHMEQVSIFFMREETPPPGQSGEVKKVHFFDYSCPQ